MGEVTAAPQRKDPADEATAHDVFISYSRNDGEFVRRLQDALAARDRRAWVDWQDIPPTAEWMAEINSAIDASDAIVFVLSPDSISSKVCGEELEHALASNKRIVPIVARAVDAVTTPEALARLNWIVAEEGLLAGAVDRLVEALDTDLDRVRAHSRLLVRAREWSGKTEDKALLLRGSELHEAETLIGADADPAPTPDQTRFVMASRRAATGRQRGVVAVATAVALAAAALGVFAWTQRGAAISQRNRAEKQTKVARSQALAAQAISKMDSEPDLAALLSLESYREASTQEALQALHVGVQRALRVARVIRDHDGSVNAVAFSPDGRLLASGSDDDSVILSDPTTGDQVGERLKNGDDVLAVKFSPNGQLLASGSKDGNVVVWDVSSGQRVRELKGHTGWAYSLAFSPDGRFLASGGVEGTTIVWDVGTGKEVDRAAGVDVAFAPNGVLATDVGPRIKLRRPAQQRGVGEPLTGHTDWVFGLAFSSDGSLLVSGSADKTVRLWDPTTGKPIGEPLTGNRDSVDGVAIAPDGSLLASAGNDGTVRLWDPNTGRRVGAPLTEHRDAVFAVDFSPTSDLLASASHDGTVILWDTRHEPLMGHTGAVNSVAFSPDGRLLASGSSDKSIRLWDVGTGSLVGRPLRGHIGEVTSVAFSPDGRLLASGGGDKSIQLWDVGTHQPVGRPFPAHTWTTSVAFSPDGQLLASGGWDRTIRIWDVGTGRPVGRPLRAHMDHVYDVAFSPDGKVLASGSDDSTVRLWDASKGVEIGAPLKGHADIVFSVSFSSDGRILASGSKDGTIVLWDTRTGREVGQPLIQEGWVTGLAFSPDGTMLVSGSHLRGLNIWDLASGKQIGETLVGHTDWVNDVAFSPLGTVVATAGADKTLVVWDSLAWSDDILKISPRLCAIAGRNLTDPEWNEFRPTEPYHRTCPQFPASQA